MTATVQIYTYTPAVIQAVDRAAYESFRHAAGSIRKHAQHSIEKRRGPSPPGEPPHTHRRRLQRAIVYFADRDGAIIGPTKNIVGTAGQPHEFGGLYKGGVFPRRPFMRPALIANLDRFHRSWGGSVHE